MSIKNTVSAIQNPAGASSTSREGGASSVTSTSAYRYPAGFSPEAFLPVSAINEQRTTAAERKDAAQRLLRELSRSSSAPAKEASTPAPLQPDNPLNRLNGLDLLIDTDSDSDLARDLTTLANSMAKLGDACGTPRDFICPSSPNSVPQSAAPLPAPAAPLSALPSPSLVPTPNATPLKAPPPASRVTPLAASPTAPAVVPPAVPSAVPSTVPAVAPPAVVTPKASAVPGPATVTPGSPSASAAGDPTGGSKAQLAVPAEANAESNYRALRDNNNPYHFSDGRTLSFRPDQLRMDEKDPTTLIGTDGNDRFDSTCFAVAGGAVRVDPRRLLRYMAGDGDDVVGGSERDDVVWGGRGKDIVLGYEGSDRLYGEEGNDQLRGGTDNDFLDGGSGEDQLLGEDGNDVLFGGTGADEMQGGRGDDIYYVDDKGDVVIERPDAGRDKVISAISYELGSNVEDLTLAEGDKLNGTGNALDNRLQGNASDNILDGGKGADIMAGGKGNDTYYIDQAGDQVQEQAGEGIDTVNAFISTTLGANVENLVLLDAGKPQRGQVDGRDVLVYGYPHAYELDYEQGDAVPGYQGDCGPTSVANLCRLADLPVTEAQVLQRAIERGWCNTDGSSPSQRGSSNALGQQSMLESFGIHSKIKFGYDEQALANFLKEGRGVIMSVNAGKLWGKPSVMGDGGPNHMITVTGVACNADTGAIEGFYIADSGRGRAADMCRYLSVTDFRQVANVPDTFWLHTLDPVKLRQQDLSATGNELDNTLVGNRGNNLIKGGLGNDTLIGQAGNDTYVFSRGDGRDVIFDHDDSAGNTDVLQLTDIRQTNLWFSQVGNDLRIDVLGSEDQITVKDWFTGGSSGSDNRIERIRTSEGYTLYDSDVAKLVQALASFAPPAATQTEWVNGQISQDKVLLTMTH